VGSLVVRVVFTRVKEIARLPPLISRRLEDLVLNHERDLVRRNRARGNQGRFGEIAQNVGGGEPCIRVEPSDADRVIVVPHQARTLVVRIVVIEAAGNRYSHIRR
jgi:hypothetical protein